MKRITKSTFLRATIASALISTLVSITIAASLYRHGNLSIMEFRIEQNTGGNWNTAPQLINGKKYRFRFDVANIATERYKNRQYDKIRFKISGRYLRFHDTPSSWKAVYDGTPKPAAVLARGETKNFYVYFRWGGNNVPTVGATSRGLKVSMTGRMFYMGIMGPGKYIQPNQ